MVYWLKSPEGNVRGPFSKDEARDVVAADTRVTFLIKSSNEGDAWSDALERLAPTPPSPVPRVIRFLIAAILSIAVGAQYGVRPAVIFAVGAALVVLIAGKRRKDTPSETILRRELARRNAQAGKKSSNAEQGRSAR